MIRALRFAAIASLGVFGLLLTSCNDGLLHAPAAAAPALVSMRTTVVFASSASAGGDANAYDRADRIFLRFLVGDDVRFEQELPFAPSAAETSVRVGVPLRQLTETVTAQVELRSASRPLFRASASAALTAGVTTPLDFTLEPVVASLACGTGTVQLTAYGQTAPLGGAALFATGDTVRNIPVTWTVPENFAVAMSETGDATALQDGDAIATCTAQGLTATRSIHVFANVSTVQVSPALGVLVVGNTLPLTATLFDSRGNAILTPRPLTWSSGSASVATVNATGVVTGVVPGSAAITATSGTISGHSDLTVVLTSTAVTNAAINISGTGATLLGTVNPRGSATQAWFEYGTDPNLSTSTATPTRSAGSGSADVALIETVAGLTPGSTYYFRTVSSGVGGTSRGSIVFFVTPRLPSVTTSSVLISQIIVAGGTATPNGTATTAWFRYGTNSTLSTFTETTHRSVGSGNSAISLADQLTGLSPQTTYYVRAVANNVGGTALGAIVSFTTGSQPFIGTTRGTSGFCGNSYCAHLTSGANPDGMPTEVWFEWSTTQSFSIYSANAHTSIGAGNSVVAFQSDVIFSPGQPFWFRAVASNAMGTVRTGPLQLASSPVNSRRPGSSSQGQRDR